jgi:transcriptional regulator with XRE-family HTH domain
MAKNIQVCLGENVRRLRIERGYTQGAFSKAHGLSISFLQNIESGKKWVGPETIEKLAHAFQVSQSELFADCDLATKPDPKAALALICEAFGILIHEDEIRNAPMKRPSAHYARLFQAVPPTAETAFVDLLENTCRHPKWEWENFENILSSLKKDYRPAT